MKWIVIFFLANNLEHVYGEVEICDYAKINEQVENESEELFDQDTNEEEDFEIPAFLRKQKF